MTERYSDLSETETMAIGMLLALKEDFIPIQIESDEVACVAITYENLSQHGWVESEARLGGRAYWLTTKALEVVEAQQKEGAV